jgi:A/G-specific adenine glycosylase
MLQQTQVATVIPYFDRFVRAFQTLEALASAREQDVLRLWEGLGYYRRARDLHRAARQVVTEHGGQLPRDPARLGELPGMGRYMVGAVLSQAFDSRLPIVEANSQRLLCRLFARRDDPRRGPARRWLWETAEALLPARGVGEFNQALMELGALVCTPASPQCPVCPLRELCETRRLGLQDRVPARPTPPAIIPVREAAAVVRRGERVLLVQRPSHGRWAGLWEFPHGPLKGGESHDEALARFLPELTGVEAEVGPEITTVRHSVTRYRFTLVCFEARHRSGEFQSAFYQAGRWVRPARLGAYPVSVPQRRLARALLDPERQKMLF